MFIGFWATFFIRKVAINLIGILLPTAEQTKSIFNFLSSSNVMTLSENKYPGNKERTLFICRRVSKLM
jgi:hypothetical protein